MPNQRFARQTVVVTGASAGIGLAVVRAFATEGANVVLAARNRQRLDLIAAELESHFPQRTLACACDVTDRTQVEQLMADAVKHFGRLDILINNAGIGLIAPFEQVQTADAHALFATNFFGPFHCLQAALPHFKRQRAGHIVNIASLAGLRGIPNSAVYAATKAALIALSDAVRIEWQDHGVHITVVCPGRIRLADTGFFAAAKKYGTVKLYDTPEISAETVAHAVLDAVSSRKRLIILPAHARFTHYLNKFAPGLLDRILYKKMPRLDSSVTP